MSFRGSNSRLGEALACLKVDSGVPWSSEDWPSQPVGRPYGCVDRVGPPSLNLVAGRWSLGCWMGAAWVIPVACNPAYWWLVLLCPGPISQWPFLAGFTTSE